MILLVLSSLVHAASWRELHTMDARATSYLRSAWNKYEENYHPNYAFDDDPKTGWVEGAEGDGVGEAIEWPITALRSGRELKLQIRSGYQKSEALFKANAAPREVKLSVLDSRGEEVASTSATLQQKMDWQEVLLKLPGDRGFNTVRLEIRSVYAGSKYRDTVISDIRTFVDTDVPANAALEASRREALLAWKKERLDTAAYFAKMPATYPWSGTAWRHTELDIDVLEAARRIGAASNSAKALATQTAWYSLARKSPAPQPDGLYLDETLPGLVRSGDFGLFEASGPRGRAEKQTEDFDGVQEVVFRRDTSNAHVQWTDATKAQAAQIWFSFKEESWSREASTIEGSYWLSYDAAGQLQQALYADRNFDEGGCWERDEQLTTFTWAGGKITKVEIVSRSTPEGCNNPEYMRDRAVEVRRSVMAPTG